MSDRPQMDLRISVTPETQKTFPEGGIADKGYDSDAFRELITNKDGKSLIPKRHYKNTPQKRSIGTYIVIGTCWRMPLEGLNTFKQYQEDMIN